MTITNFRKAKNLKVTEVSGQPTISRTVCLKITSGDDMTTGTGEIVLDWSNIADKSDIGIYDENNNLLDYYFESFDAIAETAVIWVYRDWVRDGTVQARIAYGNGPSDQSVGADTVFDKETDLKAGYLFNESSGSLLDVTSNNNDGTVSGATRGATGIVDGAYSFDGSDDYVATSDYFPEEYTDEIFIEGWLYTNTNSSEQIIVSHHKDGDYGYEPSLDGNGNIYIRTSPSSNNWNDTDTGFSYSTGTWFHIAIIVTSSNRYLYIDGSQVWSDSNGGLNYPTDHKFGIGAKTYNYKYDSNLDGRVDNLHIRKNAPTNRDDTVAALYDATKSSPELFDQEAGSGTATISGTVNLSSSGVEGAKLFLVNETTGQLAATTTTDVDGNYKFGVGSGNTYHVVVQYDDGSTKYNAKSKPYLVP